jgi:glyoxylase-like metal-dependent hydrolase (beta-lactamase superfamily II)
MLARPENQPPGLYHHALGDIVVTTVNDGTYQASFDMIVGVDHKECERIESAAFRVLPPLMTMNTFLLQLGGKLVLIDAGSGVTMGPTLGKQVANLAAMGVAPTDIDAVLITHLHEDHMNGLIDGQGAAIFPRAEIVINEAELRFHDDPTSPSRAPEEARKFFAQSKAALAPYRQRIRTVKDGPVMPGVTAVTQPGHTPGQTAWLVESKGDAALIMGDILHMPTLQLAAPQAGMVFDIDREQAAATRRRALEWVTKDRLRVAGIHFDFPAFGHIARAGDAYRFVPEVWKVMVWSGFRAIASGWRFFCNCGYRRDSFLPALIARRVGL